MLLVRLSPHSFIPKQVLHLGEQILLLIVMMGLDKTEPGLRVSDKVGLVGILDMRGLEVDGVEATDDGIVEKSHVSGACRKEIRLQFIKVSYMSNGDGSWVSAADLLGLVLRRHNELHGPISPLLGRRGRHPGVRRITEEYSYACKEHLCSEKEEDTLTGHG